MTRTINTPQKLILDKSKEILYMQGYKKLSMRNIADACGIGLGTIYNYYPTKKALIIDMITNYWHEFFYRIEYIGNLKCPFYEKINEIFNELSMFIKIFKEVWLKQELLDNPSYIESGKIQQNIYIEKLITFIENIIFKEIEENKIQCKIEPYKAAKFIILNYITIIQMPVFNYSEFEDILKELINTQENV